MNKKVKILKVSPELLCEALHLPEGTSIEYARSCLDTVVLFRVSHPDFDEVPENYAIPETDILIHRGEDGTVTSQWLQDKKLKQWSCK